MPGSGFGTSGVGGATSEAGVGNGDWLKGESVGDEISGVGEDEHATTALAKSRQTRR